jgi:hypothetical protein
MLSFLNSPGDVVADVAKRARALRLQARLTQEGLAARAGMSPASLKRFERTGLIAFDSLVRIAYALNAEKEFSSLFPPVAFKSIEDVLRKEKTRKRGILK